MPNLDWCPRTLQKQHFRKVFVPCWSIWCQTCAGGDFSASQHGDPEPVKNLFFVRRSSHSGPFGATTGLGGDLSASWHGVPPTLQKLLVRRAFVPCWDIWCQTGPGRQTSASQHVIPEPFENDMFARRSSHLSAKLHPKLKLNVSKNQETNERNLERPIL